MAALESGARTRKEEGFLLFGYAKHSFRSRLGVESHLDNKMRFGDKAWVVSSLSATFIRGGQTAITPPCRFDDSCRW